MDMGMGKVEDRKSSEDCTERPWEYLMRKYTSTVL